MVDILFIVAPIVSGFLYLVLVMLCSISCCFFQILQISLCGREMVLDALF